MSKVYSQLLEYTEEHFESEEDIQSQYNYPDKEHHKVLHNNLKNMVMDLNKNKDYMFSINVEEFLFQWLNDHIMIEDKKFVDYIKENFNT